jgi:ParB family transcriptional regulator, chromosome partitioning protein
MQKQVAVSSEYRNLPLAQLQESPTNPRRRFDERALEELAASFAAQGVLQPLLVREVEENKYEVVAGARRLRAAKLAAMKEIPARIVALSDIEVLECQLVELSIVVKRFLPALAGLHVVDMSTTCRFDI